ncbi:hypothetical protein SAMN05421766_101573 [Zobellia uliginosa]|uniref:Uncharacterized protein n=1 Tax=Zobellia uliginosa TaxID=143224 RepID=A0ABY1KJ27_9FLAO|nr:hypothetical protein [Zobellia uliginosa]SIS40329.1 hypothetical protein SAMN05421766_101573 [Zobellia uliginosa]
MIKIWLNKRKYYSLQGFSAGKNGVLGAPEWHLTNQVEFTEGAEIFEIFNDGTEILRARIVDIDNELKFIRVN